MAVPQVFVSHSHADNDYCRAFVEALRHALGDEHDAVWYDEHNLGWGELWQEIDRQLLQRQHFIAILSPDGVTSNWVNREIHAAMSLLDQKHLYTIQIVIAAPCQVSPLLQPYKRIEQRGGQPYPPATAAMRAHRVIVGDRLPPPTDRLPPLGPAPAPANSTPALHLTPTRLYNLGYRGYTIGGVECILPPICPVPGGVFTMGSDKSRDKDAEDDETPQHPVEVNAFAIGQHPVTVAEYACAVRADAVREPPKGRWDSDWQTQQQRPDHPVVCITWSDTCIYTSWLTQLTGQPWRLPTEAEWEKAARGTDRRIYPWGDIFDWVRCNGREAGLQATTAIGNYPSGESPYHVQDMAGNVLEWTSSQYERYPYNLKDGREAYSSIDNRVLRGGSWRIDSGGTRVAFRLGYVGLVIISALDDFGFRLAWGAGG